MTLMLTTRRRRPDSYVFSDASDREGARLRLMASLLDPLHRPALLAAGLGSGARCLEVGTGTGTIARWMSSRVGSGGHVLATDIDLSHLTERAAENLAVSTLDVTTDPIPERSFDLITARALLHHLPAWPDVIASLRAGLRPGGYLVLMEPDIGPGLAAGTSTDEALRRFWTGWDLWACSAGIDYHLGHKLPGQVSAAGLEVHSAGEQVPFYNGGSAWAEFYLRTLQALPPLTEAIDPDLSARFRRVHGDRTSWTCSFGWVSVVARAR
jgi:SAM-dependent methyltransferase